MKLTWLGHAAFRIEIKDAVILIDPFFTGNPKFPGDHAAAREGVTHIVLTHGHGDHVGDTVSIAKATGAKVIGDADLVSFLARQGVANVDPMNSGGTVDQGPFRISYTVAHHSSAMIDDNGVSHSLGHPHGVVIRAPGEKTLYHAGDTDIFSDMALIDEIYQPKIGILPIGDRFTMGGAVAAMAARRFFHFETVIPGHYASFPMVDATADAFLEGMKGAATKVVVPTVGETLTL
ncbi:metal-dependent hydrolase [Mesorhizobium sp. BR1-1-16]|uniref:metal-dependent hydrolase n=1 Tax=Mesorhizobium sp. BR1-1-16 TaxID=2876653 RepID=UPI001CCC1AAD|nr:metal-dependent hydrolase [Mesorhizobium sp. BR1-1-16]MBZ9936561.1 metal-dependent hydrolase [Mesorhizobium sp. BR1-1-16]